MKCGYLCVCLQSPELNQTLWRKSSQWFTLIREHAAVVLDDVAIFSAFQAHCDGKKWDADLNATRWCCPDEVGRRLHDGYMSQRDSSYRIMLCMLTLAQLAPAALFSHAAGGERPGE